jgi:hypothetical protein
LQGYGRLLQNLGDEEMAGHFLSETRITLDISYFVINRPITNHRQETSTNRSSRPFLYIKFQKLLFPLSVKEFFDKIRNSQKAQIKTKNKENKPIHCRVNPCSHAGQSAELFGNAAF